jgi:hypothetical protein
MIFQRAYKIIINNPLAETPSASFDEEQVIYLDNNLVAKLPCGSLTKQLTDLNQRIPLINPQYDIPLGTTMSYLDIYVVLYSVYRFLANLRDTPDPTFGLYSMGSSEEGDTGITNFQFLINFHGNDGSVEATVDWAVTGTGDNPADADDFGGTFPSGTLSFGVNEFFKFFNVPVSGDAAVELNENFKVTLSNAQGATIFPHATEAVATITNDDTGE